MTKILWMVACWAALGIGCGDGGAFGFPDTELVCHDGVDDDDDGSTDCDDSDCAESFACVCGDGTEDSALGEDETCPADALSRCGNGTCDTDDGENLATCAEDCAVSPLTCGDSVCDGDGGEDIVTCPLDCDSCGNFECEPTLGEDETTCESDCGCVATGATLASYGAGAACTTCIEQLCPCAEKACDDGVDCSALTQCGQLECVNECSYPVCSAGVVLPFYGDCATCLDTSCCTEFDACIGETACLECLGGVQDGCDATALDEAFFGCEDTNCASECAILFP